MQGAAMPLPLPLVGVCVYVCVCAGGGHPPLTPPVAFPVEYIVRAGGPK